jgi:hypothetical protein
VKLFTLDEARAALPRLRALLGAMQERKARFDRHREALAILTTRGHDDGDHLERPRRHHRAAVEALAQELQDLIAQVERLGAEVKGIEEGLIDFPAERDGRVVYLCWRAGEEDIAFWHDLDAGFRGRQPL